MKELTDEELAVILRKFRMSSIKFTLEKKSTRMLADISDMLRCKDTWLFIGWTPSDDVEPRDECPVVCMFEHETGVQAWCHAKFSTLEIFVYEIFEKNPKILEPL